MSDKKTKPDNVVCLDTYRKKRQKMKSRKCNLCQNDFIPESKFDRFCKNCKENDERFKYGEWLNASSY